jgi:hypothetical protein
LAGDRCPFAVSQGRSCRVPLRQNQPDASFMRKSGYQTRYHFGDANAGRLLEDGCGQLRTALVGEIRPNEVGYLPTDDINPYLRQLANSDYPTWL